MLFLIVNTYIYLNKGTIVFPIDVEISKEEKC
jgi:hypothetical protein